jgi:hypothetical protein
MGLPVSSGLGAKMPPEGFVRPIAQVHRPGAIRSGLEEREQDPEGCMKILSRIAA